MTESKKRKGSPTQHETTESFFKKQKTDITPSPLFDVSGKEDLYGSQLLPFLEDKDFYSIKNISKDFSKLQFDTSEGNDRKLAAQINKLRREDPESYDRREILELIMQMDPTRKQRKQYFDLFVDEWVHIYDRITDYTNIFLESKSFRENATAQEWDDVMNNAIQTAEIAREYMIENEGKVGFTLEYYRGIEQKFYTSMYNIIISASKSEKLTATDVENLVLAALVDLVEYPELALKMKREGWFSSERIQNELKCWVRNLQDSIETDYYSEDKIPGIRERISYYTSLLNE